MLLFCVIIIYVYYLCYSRILLYVALFYLFFLALFMHMYLFSLFLPAIFMLEIHVNRCICTYDMVFCFTCWFSRHCTGLLVVTALYSLVVGSRQATYVAFNPTQPCSMYKLENKIELN